MIESPSKYLFENATDMKSISIIDSCYEAINEGIDDSFIITTAVSYTQASLQEFLDRTRTALMNLYETVLSYLNNYILNNAKLADRYRELIIERYQKLGTPILHRTYQYPELKNKNYPLLMASTGSILNAVRTLQSNHIENQTVDTVVAEDVNKLIMIFSKSVIDGECDPYNINASVEEIVRLRVKGREMIKRISKEDIGKFIDECNQYKALKDSIMSTKKNMLEDYKALKSMMSEEMKRSEAAIMKLDDALHPDVANFKTSEYRRFASINVQLTRLYNAFIQIYSKAFDTKLKILQEKIQENKDTLTKIMVETSTFAAINPKIPNKGRRPQKFDPKLKA